MVIAEKALKGAKADVETAPEDAVLPVTAAKLPEIRSLTTLSPRQFRVLDNPSRFDSTVPEAVEWMQELAYLMSKEGNKDPVEAMKIPGNNELLDLVAGFTRHGAGMLIVNGFDYTIPSTGQVVRVHNPNFKLRVNLLSGNEVDKLKANGRENTQRLGLTSMDLANLVRKCEEVESLSVAETAEIIGCDASLISQYRKLQTLPRDIQILLHRSDLRTMRKLTRGGVTKVAWRTLAKITELDAKSQKEWYDKIRSGEKVTLEHIRESIHETRSEDDEDEDDDDIEPGDDTGSDDTGGDGETGEGGGSGRSKRRGGGGGRGPRMQITPKKLRQWMEPLASPSEYPPLAEFANFMVKKFLPGDSPSEKKLANAYNRLLLASHKAFFQHLVEQGHIDPKVAPDDATFLALQKSHVSNATVPTDSKS